MDNEQSLDLVESANQAEPTEQPLAQEPNSTPEPEGNLEPTEVGDTEASGTQESEGEKAELPKGIEKRLAKLTAKKYEQADKIAALERQKHELESKLASQAPKTREEFASEEDFIDYKVNSQLDNRLQEQQFKQQAAHIQQQQASVQAEMWSERVSSVSEEIPDLLEVVGSVDIPMPVDALQVISESDQGPKMAYYLAKNPTEAQQLNYMDERARDRKLMQLEMELKMGIKTVGTSKPVTNATPTPKSNGGRAGAPASMESLSTGDWMKARRKQVRKR